MSFAQRALFLAALGLPVLLFPVTAFGQVMFDSIANPLPGNVSSLGYEATSTSEFGLGVIFAPGTPRRASSATVIMSSWGCVTGHHTKNPAPCLTPAGSTFTHPITLKVYEVGPANAVGALLLTRTQTFTMPYRPSADLGHCPGGQWYQASTATCFNGFAFPITFDLPGSTLPNQVIVTVAYNTTHYGASPLGQGTACFIAGNNCPYDSLNVSAKTLGPPPAVGTFLDPDSAYLNSSFAGSYNCGGPAGSLRLDGNGGMCWTGFLPQIRVNSMQPDYQVRYFSNLNIGDSVINLSNDGASTLAASMSSTSNGNICANVFTYSPDEQLISCCSCLVTPNGLASLSVRDDLAATSLTPIVASSVVVKLVATLGGATASTCNAATLGTVSSGGFAQGMKAWGTTLHKLPVTPGTPATTYGVAETRFKPAVLSEAELLRMSQLCGFIQANGSGFGICKTCREGGMGASKR